VVWSCCSHFCSMVGTNYLRNLQFVRRFFRTYLMSISVVGTAQVFGFESRSIDILILTSTTMLTPAPLLINHKKFCGAVTSVWHLRFTARPPTRETLNRSSHQPSLLALRTRSAGVGGSSPQRSSHATENPTTKLETQGTQSPGQSAHRLKA
jgi:hypothetical protein